ncbi:MAG: HypC/HybG/HupF family hydrogenase formation chaperone [Pseudomonadota bacterium]
MCVGTPMRLVTVDGLIAVATDGQQQETLDLALVGPQPPGTWVLAFLGTAREVLAAEEAAKIAAALDGLRAVMAGGDLGNAFADLEERAPALPPHLEAARARGLSEA